MEKAVLYLKKSDPILLKKARSLSRFLGISIVSTLKKETDVILMLEPYDPYLFFPKHNFEFRWDFTKIRTPHKELPLIKAIGKKPQIVYDLTAGFGRDSWLLARMGHKVFAVEKNKIAYLIFKNAMSRAFTTSKDTVFKIRLCLMDSLTLLKNFSFYSTRLMLPRPDVIYLDPFLPPRSIDKRLPKKYIQALRIIGQDEDNGLELIKIALKTARKKVVVKRSPKFRAQFFEPSFQVKGKSVVFDVYLTKK